MSRRVRRRHSRPRLKCVEVRRHAIMPWLYRSSARSEWVQCEPKAVCRYARRSLVALSIGMRMGEASLMRSCLAVMAMPFILLPPLRELMAEHIELFVRCIVTHPGEPRCGPASSSRAHAARAQRTSQVCEFARAIFFCFPPTAVAACGVSQFQLQYRWRRVAACDAVEPWLL